MTIEEIVKLIRDGQDEYIPQLWDQVHKFICLMAKKRLIGEADYIKQLEDDLINESYFDFLQAVDGYKPEGGASFLTYLTYCLKNSFNRAMGVRTSKDKRNIMHHAVSLDTPVDGTEDLTLQDMIIDHLAEEDYRFIEQQDFWGEINQLLKRAIFDVVGGKAQEVLLSMLDSNCTFSNACRILDVQEDKRKSLNVMYNAAIRQLRIYLRGRAWQECQQIGIDTYLSIGLHGSGLSAYRNHGFTSATERAAIKLADAEVWNRKLKNMFQ